MLNALAFFMCLCLQYNQRPSDVPAVSRLSGGQDVGDATSSNPTDPKVCRTVRFAGALSCITLVRYVNRSMLDAAVNTTAGGTVPERNSKTAKFTSLCQ